MNLRYKCNSLAFSALLLYPQVEFFLSGGGRSLVIIGGCILMLSTVLGQVQVRLSMPQFLFLGCLFLMWVLSFTLLIWGDSGYFQPRNIMLSSVVQILLVILLFDLCKSEKGQDIALRVMQLVVLIEAVIIFGQFTYITYGVGLPPKGALGFDLRMIGGSYINPNNTATFIGLFTIAISAFLCRRGRYGEAYIFLFIAAMPIWLTLSRTMLVVWVLNVIVVMASAIFAVGSKNGRVSMWRGVVSIFAVLTVLGLTGKSFLVNDSSVTARSIERMSTITGMSDDVSANFRVISHIRLLESLPRLGLGSYSDLNYAKYYKSSDDWLMTANPHSYIVEYSFLFGVLGLFVVLMTFGMIFFMLASNKSVNIGFKLLTALALFLSQAVPSSLLASPYFFVPFVFVCIIDGGVRLPNSKAKGFYS
ncbi:MAG: hypothetical protein ACI9I4_000767 [Neolewinella sp.]|jgi:hypothetical protein